MTAPVLAGLRNATVYPFPAQVCAQQGRRAATMHHTLDALWPAFGETALALARHCVWLQGMVMPYGFGFSD